MNAHEPLYDLRESDPARFEFIDGDMLAPRLVPVETSFEQTLEALGNLWVDVFVEFCAEHDLCRKECLSKQLDAIAARERAVGR